MPRASVGVGPVRVGSGCCLAVVGAISILAILIAVPVALATNKQYVLKHPKHEHCKAHYVKKIKYVREHGHKIKQDVCQFIVPQSTTPTPTKMEPELPKEEAKMPIATTTTLTATSEKECKPVEGANKKFSICTYTVTYQTVNSKGEAVPGETIIKEHVPPSQEERKLAISSGTVVSIGWSASLSSFSTECSLNSVINKVEQPSYACEKQNPREILVAEYIPASGYLASQSESITLQ
jgi:hypothetical protein